jgi:hypothetical protein
MDQSKCKIVFKEDNIERPKVLWGSYKDLGDFIEVLTTDGNKFTVNKKAIIFIKEGGY